MYIYIYTVNLRVLVEKFTPRIVYVKSGVDFYAQTGSFHRKSMKIAIVRKPTNARATLREEG